MKAVPVRIGVLPLGGVPDIISKVVAAHISGYLGLASTRLPAAAVPAAAFDPNRGQFDALHVIRFLESRVSAGCEKVIAVIDADLFIPIFTHVMGEARQGGTIGIVSLYRLRSDSDGSSSPVEKFYERTAKVALHELGHLFNGFHCDDRQCLMHFSGSVEDLDRIALKYCRYCRMSLREAVYRIP